MTSLSKLGTFSPIVGYLQVVPAVLWKLGWDMLHGLILGLVFIIVSNVDNAVKMNACWIITFIGN
jgi:hypothetical protein